jgi:hydroxyacylglutathione hydrolase
MLQIVPIPAFRDNYIWLLHNSRYAIVVDPGDTLPVQKMLSSLNLQLSDILITHYHDDHIGGVEALIQHYQANVYAPRYGRYTFQHYAIGEGDKVSMPLVGLNFQTMWLPGHTQDHIAYLSDKLLFCGDVLFGAGCGRLLDGTPDQMLQSLNRLKKLPVETRVFCAHEYTLQNIAFALTLEPNNPDLIERQHETSRLREQNLPSLPSTIDLELKTNPFLRCQQADVIKHSRAENPDELSVFAAIRKLKNNY